MNGGRSPLAIAARGKGAAKLLHRTATIGSRYGATPSRMEVCLDAMLAITERYDCRPTLPITAAAVERNRGVVARYAARGVEFAVHGLHHIDHTALTDEAQVEQLGRARQILMQEGVAALGFRAPYLRWNGATVRAAADNGFLYETSPAVNLDVEGGSRESASYRRALTFYGATPAKERPVLPWIHEGLVRIPYCLPDDEAVVERLGLTADEIAALWCLMFRHSYERSELFTLGIHPERISQCSSGIDAVLRAAREVHPRVWVASLEEIARWWRDRARASISIRETGEDRCSLSVQGPEGLTLEAGAHVVEGARSSDGYFHVHDRPIEVRGRRRPFLGVSPSAPPEAANLLREEGYIIEVSDRPERYAHYLAEVDLVGRDLRPLLAELDRMGGTLVRLARWPAGARSAIAVTGDIDALTIWDYALRFLGR